MSANWKGRLVTRSDLKAAIAGGGLLTVALLGEVSFPTPWILMSACIFLLLLSLSEEEPRLEVGEILGLATLGWALMAALLSSPDYPESRQFLIAWFGAWVIFVVLRRLDSGGRWVIRNILGGGAVLLAMAIIFEFIGLQSPRAAGLLSNSNLAAAIILPVIPLFFMVPGKIPPRIFLTGITGIALLLSGSRAALLALLLLLLSLLPRGRKWRLLSGGLVFGATAGLIWRLSANPESLAWFRWKIWGAVIRFLSENPLFGSGAASLSTVMGPYRLPHPAEVGNWSHIIGAAENSFLGLAARIGLPGLFLSICALGLWLYGLRPLSRWKRGILIVFSIFLLFHDFLEEPAVLWWWAAIAALISSNPLPRKLDRSKSLLPILTAATLGACIILEPAWALELWWRQAPSEENAGRVLRADPWFSPALKWRVTDFLRHPPSNWDEALSALELSEKECHLSPGVAAAWDRQGLLRSNMALRFGAFPELIEGARRCFRLARTLEPHLPWYSYHLAQFERSLGNPEASQLALRDALFEEKHFTRAWLLLARTELDLGDPSAAEKALENALESRRLLLAGRATISYHSQILEAPRWQFEELEQMLQ